MINNFKDLEKVCSNRYNELNKINEEYLNEAGKAAKESWKTVLWHLMFHDSFNSLIEDEEFSNLINKPDQHPEYYKIVRDVNRFISTKLETKE